MTFITIKGMRIRVDHIAAYQTQTWNNGHRCVKTNVWLVGIQEPIEFEDISDLDIDLLVNRVLS